MKLKKKLWGFSLIGTLCLGAWSGIQVQEVLHRKGCQSLPQNVMLPQKGIPIEGTSKPLRFIALGDTGTGNEDQVQTAKAVREVCAEAGCDFLLLLGDNFYPRGVESVDDSKWKTHFEDLYRPLNKPVFAVLGNHDVKGDSLAQVMYSLKSPIWRMPNFEYAFQLGPAQFFAVNTECNPLAGHTLYEQIQEASDAPWRFVFTHRPLYGSGTHGDADWILRVLWQTFLQDSIDFYLSGHNHELEHLRQNEDATEYIVSGAGGRHYRSEKEKQKKQMSVAHSQFSYQDNGFVWFEVLASEVRVRFYDARAKVLYEFTKKKS